MYGGTLLLKVIGAKQTGMDTRWNVFLQLECQRRTYCTKIIEQACANPVWNQTLEI